MDKLVVNSEAISEVSFWLRGISQRLSDTTQQLSNMSFEDIGHPRLNVPKIKLNTSGFICDGGDDLEELISSFSNALKETESVSFGISKKVDMCIQTFSACEERLCSSVGETPDGNGINEEPVETVTFTPISGTLIEPEVHYVYMDEEPVENVTVTLRTGGRIEPEVHHYVYMEQDMPVNADISRQKISNKEAEDIIKFLYGKNALDRQFFWVIGNPNNPEFHEMKDILIKDPALWTDKEKEDIVVTIKAALITARNGAPEKLNETISSLYKELSYSKLAVGEIGGEIKKSVVEYVTDSSIPDITPEIGFGEGTIDSLKTGKLIVDSLNDARDISTVNATLEAIARKEAAAGLPKSSFTVNEFQKTGNSVADGMIDKLPKTSNKVSGTDEFEPDSQMVDRLSDLVISLETELRGTAQ